MTPRQHMMVVGSYHRILTVKLRTHPLPGESIGASKMHVSHGGRGSNQAIQASRVGASVELIAAIGMDGPVAEARALWQRSGIVECAIKATYGADTGSTIVLAADGSDASKITLKGANACLSQRMIEGSEARIEPLRWFSPSSKRLSW